MPNTVITPTDVITAYGAHYINEGQNLSSLLMRPFEAFGTRAAFTNVPTDDTQIRYSDVTVGEILQPYQDTYTPKGSVVFKPVTIDLQQVKMDQQFNPNNLVYSWLGFLTSNATDRSTWPFVRWIMEVYLLQQTFQDLEKLAVYSGVKAAPVAGTAGNAADIINGVKKLINDNIASVTKINTGAASVNPEDWCTQIEEFVKGIPELYWDKNLTINMNRTLALRYVEGKKKKYNMYYAQEGDLMNVANFPNMKVAGRASMNGSGKIWATPIENAIFAAKGFGNASGFELEKVDRTVKIWTDFHIGLGFLLLDLVFTNDQDL